MGDIEQAPGARHRTLWISDVHLGSPGCKAGSLAQFLKENDCEQLYLVGDIFDGWKLKQNFYWTREQSMVIRRLLTKARRGTRVNYLAGNHDAFLRQFVRTRLRLGNIRLMREAIHSTADGRRLLVTHGDRFDTFVNRFPRMSLLADFGYEKLMRLSDRVNVARRAFGLPELSISARVKDGVKSVVQLVSGFDGAVIEECRTRRLHGVLCGHTHHAETRLIRDGITSYNCGDWVESCTALAEDFNGVIRIIHYDRRTPTNVRRIRSRVLTRLRRIARNPPTFEQEMT